MGFWGRCRHVMIQKLFLFNLQRCQSFSSLLLTFVTSVGYQGKFHWLDCCIVISEPTLVKTEMLRKSLGNCGLLFCMRSVCIVCDHLTVNIPVIYFSLMLIILGYDIVKVGSGLTYVFCCGRIFPYIMRTGSLFPGKLCQS